MKYIIYGLTLLLSIPSKAQPINKSTENLSSLMGAISHVIDENTKVPGKVESDAKLSPPAAATLKTLENDLDNCQTSKTTDPKAVAVEKNGVQIEFKKFDLRIYGENCPFEITASVKTTEETQVSLKADFLISIVFKKQSFIDKYRLKFIEMKGLMTAQAQQEGNIVKIPVSIELQGNGESLDLGSISQKNEPENRSRCEFSAI